MRAKRDQDRGLSARLLPPEPRLKLFLSSARTDGAFGDGKWRLLDAVRREGSIRQATAALGRSYRKAWGDIKRAEEGLGRQLVVTSRGGAGRGSARLTPFAEQLLAAWGTYRSEVRRMADDAYQRLVAPVLSAGEDPAA